MTTNHSTLSSPITGVAIAQPLRHHWLCEHLNSSQSTGLWWGHYGSVCWREMLSVPPCTLVPHRRVLFCKVSSRLGVGCSSSDWVISIFYISWCKSPVKYVSWFFSPSLWLAFSNAFWRIEAPNFDVVQFISLLFHGFYFLSPIKKNLFLMVKETKICLMFSPRNFISFRFQHRIK